MTHCKKITRQKKRDYISGAINYGTMNRENMGETDGREVWFV